MISRALIPLLLLTAGLAAPALPADDGLLLDLVLPPRADDRFQHAEFSCWLPDAGKPVKAVLIHQHGCSSASPEKHPPITSDWHWRALARKHDCALLVPMYQVTGNCADWNDPESGSERSLFTALEDFARRSARPELTEVPWLLWGHSGGSSWSAQMIVRHPGRVLAASFRGGCHKQFGVPEFREKFIAVARELPLLFVWGLRESTPPSNHFVSWVPMNTMFHELRAQGGRVCRVIDPRSEHGCDDSRLMSINFFDAVLSGDAEPGSLADIATRQERELTPENATDPALTWRPNARFGQWWREFSEHGTLRPAQPPAEAPRLQAERQADGRVRLSWRIAPELAGGLRAVRLHRDGRLWKELALKEGAFLATGRDSTPEELRPHSLTDDSPGPHTYSLTYLDNAGRESPPSTSLTAP